MPVIRKVLIANRGEIAVRIIRAARDSGIGSVAVYADQDRDALHAKLADEAYALDGTTSADTYLVDRQDPLDRPALRCRCRAPRLRIPRRERRVRARGRAIAGLIWIGPCPEAIEKLGDKVTARHIAEKVGAPLAPGTPGPGRDRRRGRGLRRGVRPADRHQGSLRRRRTRPQGRPRARRGRGAVRVGDTRGRRGVRTRRVLRREVPRQAPPRRDPVPRRCRTATSSWSPRATARCSAVTRSSSRRRPRRSSPTSRTRTLYDASKAILKEVGYVGAGTCEFLVGADGTISFLEVNTRLQVEHPVSEEITDIDLVREQFRIAAGGTLDYDDPDARGPLVRVPHQRRGPGPRLHAAARPRSASSSSRGGPGVRVDSGVTAGDEISGAFDSMLAKLIVTGATREEALERSRRALDEFEIAGLPDCDPLPPRRGRRPSVRAPSRPVRRLHPLDRDRVRQPTSRPWDGEAQDARGSPRSAIASSSRSNGKRVEVSLPDRITHRPAADAPSPRRRRAEPPGDGRLERRIRRRPEVAHAGDRRQARGRGGPGGRQGRPRGRARGDEDGAAAHRPQGRARREDRRTGRQTVSARATSCCRSSDSTKKRPSPRGRPALRARPICRASRFRAWRAPHR